MAAWLLGRSVVVVSHEDDTRRLRAACRGTTPLAAAILDDHLSRL